MFDEDLEICEAWDFTAPTSMDDVIDKAVDAMCPDFEPYSHYVPREYFEQIKNEKQEKLERFMASGVPKTPNELRADLDFLTNGHYFSFDDFCDGVLYVKVNHLMDSSYDRNALSTQLGKLFAAKYKDSEQIAVVVADGMKIFNGLYLYISKDGSPLDKKGIVRALNRAYTGTHTLLN